MTLAAELKDDANGPDDALNVTNAEHAVHHIVTPLMYSAVFGTLLLFTLLTVIAAYIDLGWANPVIALGIASFKAVIVILFFMHALYQSKLIKMTIGAGFFVFLILVVMTLSDYVTRSWGQW